MVQENEGEKLQKNILGVIIVGVVLIIGIVIFTYLGNIDKFLLSDSSSSNFTYLTPQTLTSEEGITSLSAQTYNQTWLDFDGVDDKVNISGINIGNATTISFWINAKSKADYKRILGREQEVLFMWDNSADHKIGFTVRNQTTSYNLWSANAFPINEWHRITGRFNGTHTVLYIDGARSNTGSGNNVINLNETDGTTFNFGGLANYFNGSIDEVLLYNYSLSDVQINESYKSSSRNLGRKIPVLSYHIINDPADVNTKVNSTNFAEQMAYLNSSGFTTITFIDFYNWTQGKFNMPKKAIILTFDDGWLSQYTNATPVMDTYGFIGVAGIITSSIGDTRMNYTQINELKNKGWEIASHSINSTQLTDMSIENRALAFSQSKQHLSGNVTTPLTFIYPGNQHNETIDTECSNYYLMCAGDSGTLEPSVSPYYSNKNSDLTGGLNRIIVSNITTIDSYAKAVDEYYGLIGKWDIQANSGSVAYDTSGNLKDGTISGATWNNDGVLNTLISGVDYTINTATGLFTASSSLLYNWIGVDWSYDYFEIGNASSSSSNLIEALENGTTWISILVVVSFAIVVLSFIKPMKTEIAERGSPYY